MKSFARSRADKLQLSVGWIDPSLAYPLLSSKQRDPNPNLESENNGANEEWDPLYVDVSLSY